MFKRESTVAQRAIETKARKVFGGRMIAIVSAIVVLVSAVSAAMGVLQPVTAWVMRLWDQRLEDSISRLEAAATNEFFIRQDDYWPGGDLASSWFTFRKQTLKFDRRSCSLQLEMALQTGSKPNGSTPGTIAEDVTVKSSIRLGSLSIIMAKRGVEEKRWWIVKMKTGDQTPNAYYMSVVSRNARDAVHQYEVRKGDFDKSANSASSLSFHVIERESILKLRDDLLHLNQWCGDKETPDWYGPRT